MHDPDFETRRLISLAADGFGGPESDVGALPYEEPGFDVTFRSMRGLLRRKLETHMGEFMHQVLDEASTMFASVEEAGGNAWHVEARLFAMMASGTPAAVAALATPEGIARIASALVRTGLAPRNAKIAFVPMALPLTILGNLSPGRLRRITHCLAARAAPGFSAPMDRNPREALGLCDASFDHPQYATRPGTVTRAIVGVRCMRCRPERRMARDWFSGFDPADAAEGAPAAWEAEMAADPDGAEVGIPTSWMEVTGLVAADHVVGALSAEATSLGFDLDLGKGTIHHWEDEGETLAMALALPNGCVLGPAMACGDSMMDGLGLLSSILGNPDRESYRHASAKSFSRFVMRGATAHAGDAYEAGEMPLAGPRDAGDGMPAIH